MNKLVIQEKEPILVQKNSMCEFDLNFTVFPAKIKEYDYEMKSDNYSKKDAVHYARENETFIDSEYLDYLMKL